MNGAWRFLHPVSTKPQGTVWTVRRDDGTLGYFKFATPAQWKYSGPMAANEWMTRNLARVLGLPVAHLEMADVVGPKGQSVRGVVSVVPKRAEARLSTWQALPGSVKHDPEPVLRRFSLLCQLVVFDAWTVNVDRAAGKNLILWRQGSDERFHWYLIDHGLTLYGAPYKWGVHPVHDPYWGDLWRYYHVPEGLLSAQSRWEALKPMVKKIEALPVQLVQEVVASVPDKTLSPDLAAFTLALLLQRQRTLRTIVERWLRYPGVKEFGGRGTL